MANKSLTDLPARTATADSDLLHINSGGTDYKQEKSNFMHGSLAQNFEVTSALTSQVDALPIDASYFGCLWNYGHVSVTGMPINALSYVKAVRANSDQFAFIEVWSALDPDGQHYIVCKNNGTWESSWTKCASKAEITSLNNSLTQCLTTTPGIITSGKDLNDYKSNGLYIIQSGVTNSPSSWCALLVIGTPTTYGVHQIAFSFSAFYVRSYTGSPMAWTNWRSLTFS